MLGLLGGSILVIGFGLIAVILRRSIRAKSKTTAPVSPKVSGVMLSQKRSPAFAVLSIEEAKAVPYPYVYVENDGSVRELHAKEREYLETPFHPSDSGRPYVKSSYGSEDGWGSIAGICPRERVPGNAVLLPAPEADPHPPMTKEKMIEFLRGKGLQVTENPDGTFTSRKR